MSAAMVGWLDRHTRACVWTLAMVAVALRALLAAYSPWSFGYVWDLYHEAIQRLYATGHLPVSTDCWECWQPPLLFLALSLWLGLATPALLREAWSAAAKLLFPAP